MIETKRALPGERLTRSIAT